MLKILIFDDRNGRFKLLPSQMMPEMVMHPWHRFNLGWKDSLIIWANGQPEPWHKIEDIMNVLNKEK